MCCTLCALTLVARVLHRKLYGLPSPWCLCLWYAAPSRQWSSTMLTNDYWTFLTGISPVTHMHFCGHKSMKRRGNTHAACCYTNVCAQCRPCIWGSFLSFPLWKPCCWWMYHYFWSYVPPCSINGGCRIVLGNKPVEDHNACSKQQNAFLHVAIVSWFMNHVCKTTTHVALTSKIHVVMHIVLFTPSTPNDFSRQQVVHRSIYLSISHTPILHFSLVSVFTPWSTEQPHAHHLKLDSLATVAQRLLMVIASMF